MAGMQKGTKFGAENLNRTIILRVLHESPNASYEDLMAATGVSKTSVTYHITRMMADGVIDREDWRIKPRVKSQPRPAKKSPVDGRKSRGLRAREHVYVPRPKAEKKKSISKAEELEARIEAVVKAAEEREQAVGSVDIVRSGLRAVQRRTRASRLG